jgi:hypothetical protein
MYDSKIHYTSAKFRGMQPLRKLWRGCIYVTESNNIGCTHSIVCSTVHRYIMAFINGSETNEVSSAVSENCSYTVTVDELRSPVTSINSTILYAIYPRRGSH